MQKSDGFYEAAIQYNKELSDFAKDLAKRLGDQEVRRWAWSIHRQHKEHLVHHKKAFARSRRRKAAKAAKDQSEISMGAGVGTALSDVFIEKTFDSEPLNNVEEVKND